MTDVIVKGETLKDSAEMKAREAAIRSAPKPTSDPRAAEMPFGEGRIDAGIFNGVHQGRQNDSRPSVDTGHRLHAATLAAESDKAHNEPPPAPVTSQGALAQDLEAAKNTAPAVSIDPVEVTHRNFPSSEDTESLTKPSPAGTGAKNEKAPVHTASAPASVSGSAPGTVKK